MYDVAIVGAGVVGSAIARELSKYKETKTFATEHQKPIVLSFTQVLMLPREP